MLFTNAYCYEYDLVAAAAATAAPAAPPRREERLIPVHPVLPLVGGVAAVAIAVFSLVIVMLPPGPSVDGRLKYISMGMEEHCGWAGVVFGTAGSLVMLCMLVPALHVGRSDLVVCVLLQLAGWNVVLGVSDTGWSVHYVGLGVFLVSNLAFHRIMSRPESPYGSRPYRLANAACLLTALGFIAAFLSAAFIPEGTESSRAAYNAAVVFEFILMGCVTAQTVCLMCALDAYASIHLTFDRGC